MTSFCKSTKTKPRWSEVLRLSKFCDYVTTLNRLKAFLEFDNISFVTCNAQQLAMVTMMLAITKGLQDSRKTLIAAGVKVREN